MKSEDTQQPAHFRPFSMHSAPPRPDLVNMDLYESPVFKLRSRGNALVLCPFEFVQTRPFVLQRV